MEKKITVEVSVAACCGAYINIEVTEEEYNSKDFDARDYITEDEVREALHFTDGIEVVDTEVVEN
jgi:hypothetical protein